MDASTIFERLQGRFADAVEGVVADNPDPYILVKRDRVDAVAAFLKAEPELEFDFLESISGVDVKDKLLVVYHLFSYKHRHAIVLRVEVPTDDLQVASVAHVWPAANWHEREQFDLFGFTFTGHPELRRIMLPEDWDGHPLRKDYVFPAEYHGITCDRPSPHTQFAALDARLAATAGPNEEPRQAGTKE